MTCARRGMSLEQRTHRPVMFQVFLLLGTSFATVEDAAHRTDARNYIQRHRPVAFATVGLRLVLCFAFNCGTGPVEVNFRWLAGLIFFFSGSLAGGRMNTNH